MTVQQLKYILKAAGAVGVAIAASVSNENMETALVARGRTADYIEQNVSPTFLAIGVIVLCGSPSVSANTNASSSV